MIGGKTKEIIYVMSPTGPTTPTGPTAPTTPTGPTTPGIPTTTITIPSTGPMSFTVPPIGFRTGIRTKYGYDRVLGDMLTSAFLSATPSPINSYLPLVYVDDKKKKTKIVSIDPTNSILTETILNDSHEDKRVLNKLSKLFYSNQIYFYEPDGSIIMLD